MPVVIEAFCEGCNKLVQGKGGVVHLVEGEAHRRGARRRKTEHQLEQLKRERGVYTYDQDGMVIAETYSGDTLLLGLDDRYAIGALIPWQVHCNNCNPHPVTEGGEIVEDEWCPGCYWWDVDKITTWSQLMEWQRHLSEKKWFEDTAWTKLLRQLDDPTPNGLRFAGVITSRAHRH